MNTSLVDDSSLHTALLIAWAGFILAASALKVVCIVAHVLVGYRYNINNLVYTRVDELLALIQRSFSVCCRHLEIAK